MSDLIERKEAIEAIKKYGKDALSAGRTTIDPVNDIVELCNMLAALPAVDAAPVVRKHCDFCGRGKPIKAFTTLPDCGLQYGTSIMATYCPNCGAKMDGEGDAE